MILAGIDEAGLGPNIGPLATAGVAFAVPDGWDHRAPWERFARAVADKPGRRERRPIVADSKLVHASGGFAALEFAVTVFASCLDASGHAPHLPILPCPAGDAPVWPEGYPWRAPAVATPPDAGVLIRVWEAANRLAACLSEESSTFPHLHVKLACPEEINHRFATGLNKNEVLLTETGCQLSLLVERFAGEGLWVMVDKQGGRNDYLPFLSRLFPGAWLETVVAGADESTYRLHGGKGITTVSFMPKADRHSFATALASMAAKYMREKAMGDFNAWFSARVPGLRPTAGYPVDARRWLNDASAFIEQESLAIDQIWRKR